MRVQRREVEDENAGIGRRGGAWLTADRDGDSGVSSRAGEGHRRGFGYDLCDIRHDYVRHIVCMNKALFSLTLVIPHPENYELTHKRKSGKIYERKLTQKRKIFRN